jgi:hypothetical protein
MVMFNYLFFFSKTDYPEAGQLYFQEAATPAMEGIISFHNDLMGIITFIAFFHFLDVV